MLKRQLAIGGAFIVTLPIIGWFSPTVAIFTVIAVLLVALYTKADQIVEFGFGPLKAKLERTVSESERLVQSLRHLAVLQAKLSVSTISRYGRWPDGGEWIYSGVNELESALRAMGVTDTELATVREDFITFTLIDFGSAILGGSKLPSKLGSDAITEWQALRKSGGWRDPDAIEAWLDKWGVKTEAHQTLLSDMRQIIANKEIANLDQFMRRTEKTESGQAS